MIHSLRKLYRPSNAPYIWMLAGCFSFAFMGEFAHAVGPYCDWRVVALARSIIAMLLALIFALATRSKLVFFTPGILWLRSCAGSLSLICTFYALTHMRTSEVLTLTNTFPIWVVFLSWPILGVQPSLSILFAALLGVFGIYLIQNPQLTLDEPSTSLPAILALVAAISTAFAMLGLHRLRGINPWAIVVHFSSVASLFVLLTFLFGHLPSVSPLANVKILLLLSGVGLTATFGQICLTRAFIAGSPNRVSIVGLTQIIFALGLDWLLIGSSFSASTLAGIGLVVAPTAWIMSHRGGN
ncbi:MAG: DMT family transporter [Gemmataceae bacterium]